MNVDDRLGRILKLLQGSIRAAGFTQTEVDERIGRRRGYLSHVFQRRVDLKLIDLLRALGALQVEPGKFFLAALGDTATPRNPLEDLVSLVSQIRTQINVPAAGDAPAVQSSINREDEERMLLEKVRSAVRRILAEEGTDPAGAQQVLAQNR